MVWSAGKSSLPALFVNKVLWEHSHTHLFTYCLQLLWLQWQNWLVGTETINPPSKPKLFTIWSCTESLPALGLMQWWFIISSNSMVGGAQLSRFFPSAWSLMRLFSPGSWASARTFQVTYIHFWGLGAVSWGILIFLHATSLWLPVIH